MPHDHHDHHHDHDAEHPAPPALPQAARRLLALRALLVEGGHLDPARLATALEVIEKRSPQLGARVVAQAWTDAEFAQRLRQDAAGAVASLGIDPGPAPLVVLENTPEVHNVVVCTLCSCYPRALLGPPPDWYKSRAYRARVVRWPREVLAEFGTILPEGMAVRVHDSTADLRYLVLPERPPRNRGLERRAPCGPRRA